MPENKLTDGQKKEVETIATNAIRQYDKGSGFTARKLADLPTDDLEVANRRFIVRNGTFANRPVAVTGQRFFATDLATNGKPTWFNGTSWVDSVGSILGSA